MLTVLRIIIGLFAAYMALVGFTFMFAPHMVTETFALTPEGSQGWSSLRSDFPGFFLCFAIFAGFGAWTARPSPLLVPLALIAIAFTGRIVSLVADGMGPEAWRPMFIEAVAIVILIAGLRLFPPRGIAGQKA